MAGATMEGTLAMPKRAKCLGCGAMLKMSGR
jgi:hypothetical protein